MLQESWRSGRKGRKGHMTRWEIHMKTGEWIHSSKCTITIMAALHCESWFLCWKTLPLSSCHSSFHFASGLSTVLTLCPFLLWALLFLYLQHFCYNLLDYIVLFTYVFDIKLRTSQDGHEPEWTPRDSRQGGLACCNSWGRKESDTTERLNWIELNWRAEPIERLIRFNHLNF